jgi:hypothetical protein
VISGRDPDHATRLLLGRQRGELVEHPARLERAGALKELGLQVDGDAELTLQRRRGQRGRPMDLSGDRLAGGENVLAGDGLRGDN